MDKVCRRCDICDYFEAEGGSSGRKFYIDRRTHEAHCQACAYAIRDDLGFNYWGTEQSYKDSSREASSKALRRAKEARDFDGYLGTTPLPYATVAPTSADLEAIEMWEDLLQEMELGNLEDFE